MNLGFSVSCDVPAYDPYLLSRRKDSIDLICTELYVLHRVKLKYLTLIQEAFKGAEGAILEFWFGFVQLLFLQNPGVRPYLDRRAANITFL